MSCISYLAETLVIQSVLLYSAKIVVKIEENLQIPVRRVPIEVMRKLAHLLCIPARPSSLTCGLCTHTAGGVFGVDVATSRPRGTV